jgi:hypothetical protein
VATRAQYRLVQVAFAGDREAEPGNVSHRCDRVDEVLKAFLVTRRPVRRQRLVAKTELAADIRAGRRVRTEPRASTYGTVSIRSGGGRTKRIRACGGRRCTP